MPYYEPCAELDACNELIERYFLAGAYEPCFAGHLRLAEQGYPLAECQVGYFYHEGLGVARDLERAFYWTERAARHGDIDAQYNMAAWFYGPGEVVAKDPEQARRWTERARESERENARLARAREAEKADRPGCGNMV